jgi:hypothetical protein
MDIIHKQIKIKDMKETKIVNVDFEEIIIPKKRKRPIFFIRIFMKDYEYVESDVDGPLKKRKKIQRPMFFIRILTLLRKKRHKKVRKVLWKETVKTYLLAHKTLFKFLEFLLPGLATLVFVMLIFIIAVIMGLTFSSITNLIVIVSIGTIGTFILFYEIFKIIIKDWLKNETNEEVLVKK